MKLLLIDDENLDLFLAKKQLGLQHEVHGFTSSQEALDWAQHNDFDIVLIDYYLGAETGSEVLKALVKHKGFSFKAFLLTNHVDDKQASVLKDEGFHSIIFKPVTLENFTVHLTQ